MIREELEFDVKRFMQDVRLSTLVNNPSLRDLSAITGVSFTTLSRWDNGQIPDMTNFLAVCTRLHLTGGDYFKWVKWQKAEE